MIHPPRYRIVSFQLGSTIYTPAYVIYCYIDGEYRPENSTVNIKTKNRGDRFMTKIESDKFHLATNHYIKNIVFESDIEEEVIEYLDKLNVLEELVK